MRTCGHDTDVAIVGAGAAGLSLAHWLRSGSPAGRAASLTVTLIDAPPGPLRPAERTWCFWERPGGPFDALLASSWQQLRVRGRTGGAVVGRPAPFRYKMLSSATFTSYVEGLLDAAPHVRRLEARVTQVRDSGDGAEVRAVTAGGAPMQVHARWAFDSRPRRPEPARTALLQHFRGWFVRTEQPCFDASVADLMDFRTPQPSTGLSFGYVLPLSPRTALVEYTEFSRRALSDEAYDQALRQYAEEVLGLRAYEVTRTEQGAIPMTDGRFRRRDGACVFRIGTSAGATRPSTGYTFAGIQRQTRAVAAALAGGTTPVPPAAYPPRALLMDAVLLRALDTGRVRGADFFTELFRHVPAERLLRFLDADTRVWEDIAIGLRTPVGPMLRTLAELPLTPRRATPAAAPGRRVRR
ncbi:lycopene cyclase family protein [Streptomyces aureocirculatus]|uniref:lycopene cyclase family protein n=1 Tax=Streptomyces aureocirculatus TaxID=67275 RepID=UPI0004C9D0A3|nr:lycopene cyclase family protein [Streptomyces aureocirculatus]